MKTDPILSPWLVISHVVLLHAILAFWIWQSGEPFHFPPQPRVISLQSTPFDIDAITPSHAFEEGDHREEKAPSDDELFELSEDEVFGATPPETESDNHKDADASDAPNEDDNLAKIKANVAHHIVPSRPGELQFEQIFEKDGHYQGDLGHQWTAELSLDPPFQRKAIDLLNRARVPFGAIVAIEIPSARLLTLAERNVTNHPISPSEQEGHPTHIALRALAPAASLIKVITATALLDTPSFNYKQNYRYTAASRRITKDQLKTPEPNALQSDLAQALATSNNGYFALQTNQRLSREDLENAVFRFGFNRVIPFDLLTDASIAQVPRSDLERARMAAGFYHTRLTPLHAALIAAAIAGDGQIPQPILVERVYAPDGRIIEAPKSNPVSRAMTADQALLMRQMLTETIRKGTAQKAFKEWPSALSHITVGGKTGSLFDRNGPKIISYTWFIGYAPVENPQIALAVMVANDDSWWQHAPEIARDTLKWYFTDLTKRASRASLPKPEIAQPAENQQVSASQTASQTTPQTTSQTAADPPSQPRFDPSDEDAPEPIAPKKTPLKAPKKGASKTPKSAQKAASTPKNKRK